MNDNGMGLLVVIVAVLAVAWKLYKPKWEGSSTAHGTSRWAGDEDAKSRGMMQGKGVPLGRSLESGGLVRVPAFHNLACFAPAGAGKGQSVIVPALLDRQTRDMTVVCFDPKGENFKLSARAREAMGSRVLRLDPFGVCGPGSDTFNPFDLMGKKECTEDARAFCEALVQRTGMEHDPHWNDQAANVLTALVSLVLGQAEGGARHLGAVRRMMTNPQALKGVPAMLREMGAPFDVLGGVLESLEDKERAGVLSTATRHTTFLDSPAALASVASSSFDARDLLNGGVTLYLVLPAHQLEAQSRWLRLVFSSLVRMVGKGGMARGRHMLMLLDEFGQMGHMPAVDQALTLMRGYGLKCAFFLQSVTQLKECFKDKEGILLDNADVQLYFGTASYETAERVSKMLGDATITVESASEGENASWQVHGINPGERGVQVGRSGGRNYSVMARPLLKPEEVLRESPDNLIAFVKGCPPLRLRRVKWHSDPAFAGRRAAARWGWLPWLTLAAALAAWACALLG